MVQPKTTFTEKDGQLAGIASGSGILPIIGPSSSGTVNTPTGASRVSDVIAAFGAGPLVEDAAYAIDVLNLKVLIIKTGASVAGDFPNDDAVTEANKGAGTSTITVDDAEAAPNGDYEVVIRFVTGGTVATTGIEYQWSLDGGRTFSAKTALGTANTISIADAGGITVDLGARTIIAGFEVSFPTRAPNFNSTELGAALDALGLSKAVWDVAHISGVIGATEHATLKTKFAGFNTGGKFKSFVASARLPDPGETYADYATAMGAEFGGLENKFGAVCAGDVILTSSVSGRQYRRVVGAAAGPLEGSRSEEENSASVNLGSIPGATLVDANGNPNGYDESVYGTLDDLRFYVLRTWDDIQGVYPNIPRVHSADGSDFRLLPHRRVMNLALRVLRAYLSRRLSQDLQVSSETGFLLKSEVDQIEKGATAVVGRALLAKPKASGVSVTLSRDDNVLGGNPVTGSLTIVPLVYPEEFELEASFTNPVVSAS